MFFHDPTNFFKQWELILAQHFVKLKAMRVEGLLRARYCFYLLHHKFSCKNASCNTWSGKSSSDRLQKTLPAVRKASQSLDVWQKSRGTSVLHRPALGTAGSHGSFTTPKLSLTVKQKGIQGDCQLGSTTFMCIHLHYFRAQRKNGSPVPWAFRCWRLDMLNLDFFILQTEASHKVIALKQPRTGLNV